MAGHRKHPKRSKRQENSKKFVELTDEERKRFNQLIVPKLPMVRQLVAFYTTNASHFDDNYSCVLSDLACYIKNFDISRKECLDSWIHVTVKNCVRKNSIKLDSYTKHISAVPYEEYTSDYVLASPFKGESGIFNGISDKMYNALMKVPAAKLESLLLLLKGYSIKEIVELEAKKGLVRVPSEDAVKKRIYSAKEILYEELYGRKRPPNHKSGSGFSKGGKGADR